MCAAETSTILVVFWTEKKKGEGIQQWASVGNIGNYKSYSG